MMNIKGSNIFHVYQIHVVDGYGEDLLHLKSTYLHFEDKESLFKKWQELIRENHYSLDMIIQETQVASAFHT